MRDSFGRPIDYIRISVTDRCNLRCQYCMPKDVLDVGHDAIVRYEELLRFCRVATTLGITKFKITGGEPFVRKGLIPFLKELRCIEGVQSVTITTNGQLLERHIKDLAEMGIDGINISLDTLDGTQYARLAKGPIEPVLSALEASLAAGIPTKVNAVLLKETKDQILPLAKLAEKKPLSVRFIELMPIGWGTSMEGLSQEEALAILKVAYPDLQPLSKRLGNGPASYYSSNALCGAIGFIAANSHRFCSSCNRMRLTSTAFLKPCLCYDQGISLSSLLQNGTDEEIKEALYEAISMKPERHHFEMPHDVTEKKKMNEIGG